MESTSDRLISLDVFRGMTIAGMILVNNPGTWNAIYPPLRHAVWNGCTLTDCIYPFFLFIVGVALTLSLTKRIERGESQKTLALQIAQRSGLLFLLGLIQTGFPQFDLSTFRIPGVLQRIAVVYFITALIFLKSSVKTQSLLAVAFLLVYWALMTLIPVPGIGFPNLEPTTNLSAYVDNLLLHGHLWSETRVWDPEGFLSTIPSLSTALAGVMLGHWLRTNRDRITKTVWMFVFGNLALVLGLLWDFWFPINKNLWTSSYVLFTGGLALNLFALCYWFIDVRGVRWWTKPFVVYGTNAITVYLLASLLSRSIRLIHVSSSGGRIVDLKVYLFETLFLPHLSPVNASLSWAICYVLIWLGLMWILYSRKIFIRV